MRVCYVLSTSETSGGANRSFIDLLNYIDRQQFVPYVLLRRHGEIEQVLNNLNVHYDIIPYVNCVKTGKLIKDDLKKIFEPTQRYRIKKYLKDNHIDLLHNNSLPVLSGMLAAKDLGIPYISHIRESIRNGLKTVVGARLLQLQIWQL